MISKTLTEIACGVGRVLCWVAGHKYPDEWAWCERCRHAQLYVYSINGKAITPPIAIMSFDPATNRFSIRKPLKLHHNTRILGRWFRKT